MDNNYKWLESILTKEQLDKFNKLDDNTRYKCVEDREGADFALDCEYTVKGWVERALFWLDSDDNLEDQVFINSLLEGGKNAIEEIDEYWYITIEEVK